MSTAFDQMTSSRLIVIYRGVTPRRCLETAHALYEAGLRCFEVTLNTEGALEAISRLRDELPDATIGAGTVLTAEQVAMSRDSGASFVISPDLNEDVVARTRSEGLVSVPGAFTATEVLRAWRCGAHIVKVFPVRPVGADHLRQLRGPIDDVPLLVSGGVNASLAAECFDAGANVAGIGLPLFGIGTERDDPNQDDAKTVRTLGERFLTESGVAA